MTIEESENWQFGEVLAGIAELDSGQSVSHEEVVEWLSSWGKDEDSPTPRHS